MTVIAAYEDKDSYWIASDSNLYWNSTTLATENKIMKFGNYYIGDSGSCRISNLMRENNTIGKINIFLDLIRIRDRIVQEIRAADKIIKEVASEHTISKDGNTFLIITKIGIYRIESDYGITKCNKYSTTGSGGEIALGSLYNSKQLKHDGKTAVTLAVKAAIAHHAYCGGKVYTASIFKGQ